MRGINLKMNWHIYVRGKAKKQLQRLAEEYVKRIELAIDEMATNPFGGDIEKMGGEENVWRRRIGVYRVKYEVSVRERTVQIFSIERRTSSTY